MLEPIVHEGRTLFSKRELACRHCGEGQLAPGVADALLRLRLELGQPMVLTSACRCKEHNDRPASEGGAGGHPRSLHVFDYPARPTGGTCAFDVRTRGRPYAYKARLAKKARALGWSIGFGNGFLHIDLRTLTTTLPRAEFNY